MSRLPIPLARPRFGDAERAAVLEVLDSGWVVQGPRVAAFERSFADFTGAPHAVAMSSATTALHAAVVALDLRPGDEVIVPAFTWVATANIVEQVGARPVFCDIDLDTYNIDSARAAGLVGPRTVGIIPVHLFGLPADMPAILALAHARGLWVVEDAACALGTRLDGRHVGHAGSIGCFSFHPRKSITTGEGGMAVTADGTLAARLRSLRDHGSDDAPSGPGPASARMPSFPRLGFNYRMTDLQGALGEVQMHGAADSIGERRRIASRYDAGLDELSWLRLPAVPVGATHGYQSYVVLVEPNGRGSADPDRDGVVRDAVMGRLEAASIGCRPGTHAPALSAYYQERYGGSDAAYPAAHAAERLSIALPIWPGLTDDEIDFVIETIRGDGTPPRDIRA